MTSQILETIGRVCSWDLECLIKPRDGRYQWMMQDAADGYFCSAAYDMDPPCKPPSMITTIAAMTGEFSY